MQFKKISDITIEDSSSWKDKVFLTFDLDWCSDQVLEYTLDIIEKNNVKATFFVTHATKVLDRMRTNPNIELGIHPNFNYLLNGDFRYGKTYKDVIDYYMEIVPEAVSVRSHSLTQNSYILIYFADVGLKYDCNQFIPNNSKIYIEPWKHWTQGLIQIPHFWEDDIHIFCEQTWEVENILNNWGLKVFDFHPIHVFLNTEDLQRYNNARNVFQNITELKKHVNNDIYGTRDFLIDLIKI